jgi:hypothetical protein
MGRLPRCRWNHGSQALLPAIQCRPTIASRLAPSACHRIRASSSSADVGASNSPVNDLIYPESPNKEHFDVPSYAAYAQRVGLDTSTTTYVGTHYEYTVAAALKNYGFYLKRVGGTGDYGIDLLGTWTVPSTLAPLRVLVQCKASSTKTKVGPSRIRELEGAFVGAPPGWRGSSVVGLLVAQKAATKGIRDSLARSQWPMGFLSCTSDGTVQQMLWNAEAEEKGLAGLGIGVRRSGTGTEQELVLTWRGRRVPSGAVD